jgi:hypothetical protein
VSIRSQIHTRARARPRPSAPLTRIQAYHGAPPPPVTEPRRAMWQSTPCPVNKSAGRAPSDPSESPTGRAAAPPNDPPILWSGEATPSDFTVKCRATAPPSHSCLAAVTSIFSALVRAVTAALDLHWRVSGDTAEAPSRGVRKPPPRRSPRAAARLGMLDPGPGAVHRLRVARLCGCAGCRGGLSLGALCLGTRVCV